MANSKSQLQMAQHFKIILFLNIVSISDKMFFNNKIYKQTYMVKDILVLKFHKRQLYSSPLLLSQLLMVLLSKSIQKL